MHWVIMALLLLTSQAYADSFIVAPIESSSWRSQRSHLRNAAVRRPVCMAGHIGFEPANPSASYLIGIA